MSKSNINKLNNATNDLILKYDEKFNELYDKKLNLDSSIMNKEEIIIKENDELTNKNNYITILKYTNVAIILFAVLLIVHGLGKIDLKKLIVLTIILIIIYLLVITFTIYIRITSYNALKNIHGVKVQMGQYIDTVIAGAIDYKCPSKCSNNYKDPSGTILGYAQPTLKTDSQLDVWRYGDIPTDLYTSSQNPAKDFYSNSINIPSYNDTYEQKNENSPKSKFNSTFPSSTYYRCKWNGGKTNNGGLPNIETNKYSSIPCSYRPNFSEEARYICTKNPNNLSNTEFNKVCNNV
jgi:hypothetical protein